MTDQQHITLEMDNKNTTAGHEMENLTNKNDHVSFCGCFYFFFNNS